MKKQVYSVTIQKKGVLVRKSKHLMTLDEARAAAIRSDVKSVVMVQQGVQL
jgi:hypothetical protein